MRWLVLGSILLLCVSCLGETSISSVSEIGERENPPATEGPAELADDEEEPATGGTDAEEPDPDTESESSVPWTIPESSPDDTMRAIHLGGNWGDQMIGMLELPEEYFEWLRDLNVNWVALCVALHVEDSMDSTVERRYEGGGIETIPDELLREVIRAFRERGFHFYLTLAFDDISQEAAPGKIVQRWQFGDPLAVSAPSNTPDILAAEFWPWDPTHPDHATFVPAFYASLTDEAVHFAELAEEEGVEMFSFGTETDRLFRTRVASIWSDHYRPYVQQLVDDINAVYTGKLTYSMYYGSASESFETGRYIWEDIDGLDLIGISSYFHLYDELQPGVPTVEDLSVRWESTITSYIEPLRAASGDMDVVLTEFGYVDHVGASFEPNLNVFTAKNMDDLDDDGIRDGEEEQANIYDSFFGAMATRPWLKGAFLWDNWITTQERWDVVFGQLTQMSIRGKLVHDVVADRYGEIAESE